jgi:hypothetical protein
MASAQHNTISPTQLSLFAEEIHKTCTACFVSKVLGDFPRQRAGKYGHRSTCRACHNAAGLCWKMANVARRAKTNKAWKLRNPDKVLRSAQRQRVHERLAGKTKLRSRLNRLAHPERVKRNKREWRQKNPVAYRRMRRKEYVAHKDAYLFRVRQWGQAHSELVRQYGIIASHRRRSRGFCPSRRRVREAILETLAAYKIGERYWDCYAGCLIDAPTIDHIIPVAADGETCYENLCVTSRRNNASKGTKSLLVWLALRQWDASDGNVTTEGTVPPARGTHLGGAAEAN